MKTSTADAKREEIRFGPFLSPWHGDAVQTPEVQSTGYALEFASARRGASIPIYRRTQPGPQWLSALTQYLFHERQAPFNLTCKRNEGLATPAGSFPSLETLLVALYRDHAVARPLTTFLGEFGDTLPLSEQGLCTRGRPKVAFTQPLTRLGFYVVDAFRTGRAVTVCVGWVSPQARNHLPSALFFPAGALEFRPRTDRSFNLGRWLEPCPGHLNSLLFKVLRTASPEPPVNCLSEEGRQLSLRLSQWTPRALTTSQETRRARVEFVRAHPHLLDHCEDLALAMLAAALYDETNTPKQILRHVHWLIAAVKHNNP